MTVSYLHGICTMIDRLTLETQGTEIRGTGTEKNSIIASSNNDNDELQNQEEATAWRINIIINIDAVLAAGKAIAEYHNGSQIQIPPHLSFSEPRVVTQGFRDETARMFRDETDPLVRVRAMQVVHSSSGDGRV